MAVIYYHCASCGGALIPEARACDSCGQSWAVPVPPEEEVSATYAAFWPPAQEEEEARALPPVASAWLRLPIPVRAAAPGGLILFLLALVLASRGHAPSAAPKPLVGLPPASPQAVTPPPAPEQHSPDNQQLHSLEEQEGRLSSQETDLEYNGEAGTPQWRVNRNEQVSLKGQITALREEAGGAPK